MSYTNANNHNFRDTSGYDPQKQTRVKCKLCGCWAKKGGPCYQCHRLPDGTLVKPQHRKSSGHAEHESEPQTADTQDASTWMYDQADVPPQEEEHTREEEGEEEEPVEEDGAAEEGKDTPTKYTNASNHNFRETSPFEPQKQIRVKCKFCGCWARKGRACYQCHRWSDGTLAKVPPRKSSDPVEHEQQGQGAESTTPHGKVTEGAKHTPAPADTTPPNSNEHSTKSPHARHPHPARAKSIPDNVLQYQFREPAPYDVSCKQKKKCPECGCWVTKGKMCTLCKRVTT